MCRALAGSEDYGYLGTMGSLEWGGGEGRERGQRAECRSLERKAFGRKGHRSQGDADGKEGRRRSTKGVRRNWSLEECTYAYR